MRSKFARTMSENQILKIDKLKDTFYNFLNKAN
jgi:hypothetical protein